MLNVSLSAFILSGLLLSNAFAASEKTQIELADRTVRGLIDHPKGDGPYPLLIVAVGDDADAKNPFYEKLVRSAVAEGFVTLRIDWSYKSSKPATNPDLKREAEELGVAIELASSRMMKQYFVDSTKLALFAKGYGAKVAMNLESGAFGEKIKAALLANPPCDSSAGSFASTYAPFLAAKTPRMIIAERGAGCPLPQIYSALKDFGEDSSLFVGEANPESVLSATANWLRARGWSPAKKAASKAPNVKKHAHDAHSAGTHP